MDVGCWGTATETGAEAVESPIEAAAMAVSPSRLLFVSHFLLLSSPLLLLSFSPLVPPTAFPLVMGLHCNWGHGPSAQCRLRGFSECLVGFLGAHLRPVMFEDVHICGFTVFLVFVLCPSLLVPNVGPSPGASDNLVEVMHAPFTPPSVHGSSERTPAHLPLLAAGVL